MEALLEYLNRKLRKAKRFGKLIFRLYQIMNKGVPNENVGNSLYVDLGDEMVL